ncbi:hypothetical protein DACRYDRAFT_18458 [Dacryopinax primogenitus]|uniref:Uncharacterized protein n=1 Tax=Dacryopinax primogenitus (strain DJM 731) TaxID=1858805 RepID=M5FS46_DACPD|nr:uncharacterized protein DACRYDRAFT_18458 [Dacryopinax primogenitus]EJT97954.1 hypothetical protein DACRYDRAFT_18458 [Dacryopinax primogenitus]
MHRFGNDDTWSIVDRAEVRPVWTIDEDAVFDDIHTGHEIVGRYTFDMKGGFQQRKALRHARGQMIKTAKEMGWNVFIREGWSVTSLRRGENDFRLEVVYRARPAQSECLSSAKEPPFLTYLPSK